MRWLFAVALAFLLCSRAALAALSPAKLNSVGAELPPGAAFPLSLSAPDLSGTRRSLAGILDGRPAFILFADYTCKTLCGPSLVLLGSALEKSDAPRDSYRIVVIGLDPKDAPGDARRMLSAQVPEPLQKQTTMLFPDDATLAAATAAVGFRYAYDKSIDQFAHPEVVYAVAADGHVRSVSSPFTLASTQITSALFAPKPDVPTSLAGRLRLICYRLGILNGPYSRAIEIALKLAAASTVMLLAFAMFWMQRRIRTRP